MIEQLGTVWTSMGFIGYPLAFSAFLVIALALFSASQLAIGGANLRTKAWIDAVLFWGGFATITGVLGTVVGIIVASQSIEAAGAVSTTLMWGGIKIALLSSAMGVVILAVSSLLWFGLQMTWQLSRANDLD